MWVIQLMGVPLWEQSDSGVSIHAATLNDGESVCPRPHSRPEQQTLHRVHGQRRQLRQVARVDHLVAN